MLPNSVVADVEGRPWFQSLSAPYLIVDTDFRIRAVNAAYEQAAGRSRAELVGDRLFEAFPDNPDDPVADGVARLSDSLETVFSQRSTHWMGLQRYDIPNPLEPGSFTRKVWTPVNRVLSDGDTMVALHHVQDVTGLVVPEAGQGIEFRSAKLQESMRRLETHFPHLPAEQIIGVITRSHLVVSRAFGHANYARTEALAGLELEAFHRAELVRGLPVQARPRGPGISF